METNNQSPANDDQQERSGVSIAEQENSRPANQREQQQNGDEAHHEQSNVTPPEDHDFPTEGPGRVNFEQRPHGRTTGRMIDHEPGTV